MNTQTVMSSISENTGYSFVKHKGTMLDIMQIIIKISYNLLALSLVEAF